MREGLRRCVTEGAARDVRGLHNYHVFGKTGTAEVNSKDENNAWFAGYVAADPARPTLAFAAVAYTVEDHGKESAQMVLSFLRQLDATGDEELRARYLAAPPRDR